jgi:lipoprotein NlpI
MTTESGGPMKTIEQFDKALSLEPGLDQAWFNKGIVLYYDQGKKGAGRKLWDELSRKNPFFMTPAGKPIAEFLKTL